MSCVEKLQAIFAVILDEAEKDPHFERRLLAAMGTSERIKAPSATTLSKPPRPGRRRSSAVLDPFAVYEAGNERLRESLAALNVEQLKDIVAEYSMDSARLALKWKTPERLIDLIVLTVETRLKKGDAFRAP